jgi:hypothetical protein
VLIQHKLGWGGNGRPHPLVPRYNDASLEKVAEPLGPGTLSTLTLSPRTILPGVALGELRGKVDVRQHEMVMRLL